MLAMFSSTSSFLSSNIAAVTSGAHASTPLPLHEALSGIFGSISLTSWLCVLIPQLVENYRNQSAEAISLPFILIWFVGDMCNLVGALWAGLVPVVIVVSAYFCISDVVMVSQVMYYGIRNRRREGRNLLRAAKDTMIEQSQSSIPSQMNGDANAAATANGEAQADETQPLLAKLLRKGSNVSLPGSQAVTLNASGRRRRRSSANSASSRTYSVNNHSGSSINRRRSSAAMADEHLARILEESSPETGSRAWLKIVVSIFAVFAIGTAGWAFAYEAGAWTPSPPEPIGNGGGSGSGETGSEEEQIAKGAQILGYTSAVLFLCARVPQIIKNWREKSCEGLAILFFILSLIGNLTYGAGIILHSTNRTYVIKNIPWLIGSLGTMVEDVIIFVQFRIYQQNDTETTADFAADLDRDVREDLAVSN